MDNKRCPACTANGHDSKGDHLWLMDDDKTWTCRLSHYHKDGEIYYENEGEEVSAQTNAEKQKSLTKKPKKNSKLGSMLGTPIKSQEDTAETPGFEDPSDYNVQSFRDIPAAVMKRYGVKTEVDLSTGEGVVNFYPFYSDDRELFWKMRNLKEKDFWWSKKYKGVKFKFFGQDLVNGSRRLYISEGQDDAMAAYDMLEKWQVDCVSTPHGDKVQVFKDNYEFLLPFYNKGELYFHPDGDEAGQMLLEKVLELLPRIKIVITSEKDACDMKVLRLDKQFVKSFWDADIHRPKTLIQVNDVIEKAMQPPKWGRLWPWTGLNKLTYGRRDGEGLYVGAGVKQGKSEFVNEMIAQNIRVEGPPMAVIKFEEHPHKTITRLAGKLDGMIYHKPDVVFDPEMKRATMESLQGQVLMFQQPRGQAADWDMVREYIRFVVVEYGVKDVVIDPITRLTNQIDSSSTEELLRRFADEISSMAAELNFFYLCACHLKAPPADKKPHERGGKVHSNQFRGSRAMMEACYQMLGIERNRDPDLPEEEQNTSSFVLLEEREYGNTGRVPNIFFNKTTQSYLEKDFAPPETLYPPKGGEVRVRNTSFVKVQPETDVSRETDKVKAEPKKEKSKLTACLNQA